MAEAKETAPGAASGDSGLGVPPFRPAATPFGAKPAAGPTPTNPTAPNAALPGAPRPPGAPMPGMRPSPTREAPQERRTLVVGRGISVNGVIQDAERLVVEGRVEATMIEATELSVSPGGLFKGESQVEDAEIAGTIDGTIHARGSLIVRATGVVLGTARCRRLQVEDGGQITGRIEMITDARPPAPAAHGLSRPVAETQPAS